MPLFGRKPKRDAERESEIDIAAGGLRYDLLVTATRYGLSRALEQRQLIPAWHEWIGYTRAVDVWMTYAPSQAERQARLQAAWHVTTADADWVARDAGQEDWSERLDGLAEAARTAEDLRTPLFEEFESEPYDPAGLALFAAIEDSLVLVVHGGPEHAAFCASADETLQLLIAARAEGVWGHVEHEARPPRPDRPGEQPRASENDARALWNQVTRCTSDALALYRKLDPQGRTLSPNERGSVEQQLVTTATLMRQVARQRTLMNDLWPELQASESTQAPATEDVDRHLARSPRALEHNFVLMLSPYEGFRERVASAASIPTPPA